MKIKPIPNANKVEFKEDEPFKGEFIIEPLYPGYGLTIGNALRRVLLSSLEGVAITSVKIKDVQHEFSSLEGVKEDIIDIILNLKQVRFKAEGPIEEGGIKIKLNAKGSKKVTAADFEKVTGVEISNPELEIANLTDAKAELDIDAVLERGRGYLPTEMMENKEKEVNAINLDALFSPVKRVSIDTANVRVGEFTDWDQLKLYVETDGSITPEEALKKAASILVNQFEVLTTEELIDQNNPAQEAEEDQEEEDVKKDEEKEEEEEENDDQEDEEEKTTKKRGRPKKSN